MSKRDRAEQRRRLRNRVVIAGGAVALAGRLAFALVPHGGQPPRDISLGTHDVIQLDVGAVVTSQPYTFPAGL